MTQNEPIDRDGGPIEPIEDVMERIKRRAPGPIR